MHSTISYSYSNDNNFIAGPVKLADDADNSAAIAKCNGITIPVVLQGRTLYRDGAWNTLCLPFNLEIEGSPLAGAEALTLTEASIDGTMLTLNFSEESVETLVAGTPYIIRWTGAEGTLTEDDLVFNGVIIDKTMHDKEIAGVLTFKGSYDAQYFGTDNRSILFLGAENTLYWPQAGASIGACRAYFQLADGITAGDIAGGARFFFGSGETQGIISIENGKLNVENENGAWYTVNGIKVEKPKRKGLYIQNGRKVVIR